MRDRMILIALACWLFAQTGYLLNFLPNDFFRLLIIFGLSVVSLSVLALKLKTIEQDSHGFKRYFYLIIGVGVLGRLIVLPTVPIFEDDFYRYLWEGRVSFHGFNPFLYPPNSEVLDGLHIPYRYEVGFLHLPTIYPPMSQFFFQSNHWLWPDSFIGLKFLFLIFDLGLATLVSQLLKLLRRPQWWFIFYFLNPMVIKEVSNSGHIDILMVFFMFLSFYLFKRAEQKNTSALGTWICLSLSASFKFVSLILAPLILVRKFKILSPLFGLILFILLYLPFLSAGEKLFSGLGAFSKYWVFNESLFYPISYLANKMVIELPQYSGSVDLKSAVLNEIPGRLLSAGLFLLVYFRICFLAFKDKISLEKAIGFSFFSLLLLSPVFNAWYALWFLPFAVISGSAALISMSMLVVFAYSWYWSQGEHYYFQAIEYGIVAFVLIFEQRDRLCQRLKALVNRT